MKDKEYIETYPYQFKDDIDKWLFKELGIIGGCCSAQGSFQYSVARMVAEKLWKKEEPVSDDLEQAAKEICSKILDGETVVIDGYEYVVLSDAEECFKAGAQWQKQQDKISTSEDLAQEIERLSKRYPEVSFAKLSRIAKRFYELGKKEKEE